MTQKSTILIIEEPIDLHVGAPLVVADFEDPDLTFMHEISYETFVRLREERDFGRPLKGLIMSFRGDNCYPFILSYADLDAPAEVVSPV